MPKNHSINRERILVVRENRWRAPLQILGLILLLTALPVIAWWATRIQLGADYRQLQVEMNNLQVQADGLKQQLDTLRQQKADLQVASNLDHQTLQQLRSQLVKWRESNEQLQEKNQFYMSLMNPSGDDGGVFIESTEIQATADQGQYSYDVLVAQRAVSHQRVNGRLDISVQGSQDGKSVTLGMKDLGLEADGQAVGFRYFQHLTGTIALPEGFDAEHMRMRVYLSGSSNPSIDEETDWPSS